MLWDQGDILVGGHHRYSLCLELHKPWHVIHKGFKDRQEVKEWMAADAFGQRNLNTFQKAEIALIFEASERARAKERKEQGVNLPENSQEGKGETLDILGKKYGVSSNTLRKVKKIKTILQKEGNALTLKDLREGETSINAVENYISNREAAIKKQKKEAEEEAGRLSRKAGCEAAVTKTGGTIIPVDEGDSEEESFEHDDFIKDMSLNPADGYKALDESPTKKPSKASKIPLTSYQVASEWRKAIQHVMSGEVKISEILKEVARGELPDALDARFVLLSGLEYAEEHCQIIRRQFTEAGLTQEALEKAYEESLKADAQVKEAEAA